MEEDVKNNEPTEVTVNQILKTVDSQEINNPENSIPKSVDTDELSSVPSDVENNIQEETVEAEKIELEDANKTNCLALTIREEHKLVAVKNVFLHSLKTTWKVIVSTIALHILKIFF